MSLGQKLVTVGLNDRWKASTLTFLASHSGIVGDYTPFFKPDGTRLYAFTAISGEGRLRQYALSSAWNLSTASLSHSTGFDYGRTNYAGLFLSSDGLKLYISNISSQIFEYNISSAWSLSSTLTLANTFSPGFDTRDFYFRDDGKLLFIGDGTGSPGVPKFSRFSLSTAWNTSTATFDQQFLSSPQYSEGLWAKPDGTKIYTGRGGSTPNSVKEYRMSTPWDITTASLRATSSVPDRGQFSIKPDGSRLYKFNYTSGVLQEYSMG